MKIKSKFLTGSIYVCLVLSPLYAIAADKIDSPPEKILTPSFEKTFNAENFKLDNGLQIVVIPNHRVPVVTQMVWYKVGAADEQPGQSGIAHFLEHLMFKGTDTLKPGEFSEIIRALGGNENAFTAHDYTAYHEMITVEHLEKIMQMEAERMRGLKLDPSQVASELKVILEERRQRIDNNPQAKFNEQMSAELYINHPYGTPVIGWMHEMKDLTQAYARYFYDHHYGPNNAILVVAGDVTGQQVYDLAKKIYGPLKPVEIPERHWRSSPPLLAKVKLISNRPDVRQGSVEKIYRVPSYHKDHTQSLALQVLEGIMDGPASRLYRALVINQKLATGTDFSYTSDAWDDTEVSIGATPAPGVNPETLDEALDEQLRLLIKSGVTDDELKNAKTRLQAAAINARDSMMGPAMIFGTALATGSTVDDVEYWPQKINAVTAADVQAAARTYLDPDSETYSSITGYLLPLQKPQTLPAKKPPVKGKVKAK